MDQTDHNLLFVAMESFVILIIVCSVSVNPVRMSTEPAKIRILITKRAKQNARWCASVGLIIKSCCK